MSKIQRQQTLFLAINLFSFESRTTIPFMFFSIWLLTPSNILFCISNSVFMLSFSNLIFLFISINTSSRLSWALICYLFSSITCLFPWPRVRSYSPSSSFVSFLYEYYSPRAGSFIALKSSCVLITAFYAFYSKRFLMRP